MGEGIVVNGTLQVIYNGQLVAMTPSDIFDSSKYTKLYAVTYSVDEMFVNKFLTAFSVVDLVVGIREDDVQWRAIRGFSKLTQNAFGITQEINAQKPVEWLEALTKENQDKCLAKQIRVRKPMDVTVHSKFYLLESEAGDEVRYVIGSANLSSQAFLSTTAQYETIFVFDNDRQVYDILKNQFDVIVDHTMDFLSETLLRAYAEKKEKIPVGLKEKEPAGEFSKKSNKNDVSIRFTMSEKDAIKVGMSCDVYQVLESGVKSGEVEEQVIQELKDVHVLQEIVDEAHRQQKENADGACAVLRTFTPNKSATPKLSTEAQVKKNLPKVLLRNVIPKVHVDVTKRTISLYSNPGKRSLDYTGLYQISDTDIVVEHPFGQLASEDQIRNGIQNICDWIGLYENYVEHVNPVYCSRVMESILYAFTSPFLHEIQSMMITGKEDIPQFLIIGGTGGSGKSNHLKYILKLLGADGESLMTYDGIVPVGNRRSADTIEVLSSWMLENNVAPICVDEVASSFFSNDNYGRKLIVDVVNRQVNTRFQACPVCIFTTNSSNYLLPPEARRRSYYLKQDKVFRTDLKKDEGDALRNVKAQANDSLFQDFCVRFSNLLLDEDLSWDVYSPSGWLDFLSYTRQIFKEYFQIAGIPLPEWFPETRFDDAEVEGKNKWRNFYVCHKDAFVYQSDHDKYVFDTRVLNVSNHRYGGAMESKVYVNALGLGVLDADNSSNEIVLLYAHAFHDWLGIPFPQNLNRQSNKQANGVMQSVKRLFHRRERN